MNKMRRVKIKSRYKEALRPYPRSSRGAQCDILRQDCKQKTVNRTCEYYNLSIPLEVVELNACPLTYANALAKRIDASFLCCTRMEGLVENAVVS